MACLVQIQRLKNRILSYTFLALIFYTFYAYGLYKMCYNKKIIMYNCLHYAVARRHVSEQEVPDMEEKNIKDTIRAKAAEAAEAAAEAAETQDKEEYGDIRIADEVICIVASLAAQEVPGVVGMSGGLTDGINRFLGKDNASKGVHLHFEGKTVNASVYIVIEYGCCIPEIALEVQEKVKDAIEAMTGYEVQFVDVNVEGVAKRRESELEKESSSDVDMAEILQAQAKRAEATEANSFEQQLVNLHDNHDFELPPEEDMDEKHRKFLEED